MGVLWGEVLITAMICPTLAGSQTKMRATAATVITTAAAYDGMTRLTWNDSRADWRDTAIMLAGLKRWGGG